MDSTLETISELTDMSSVGSPPKITSAVKRSATEAGLKQNGSRPAKTVKRRASKACQCCRARKVRCNVVEHGAPCTNCRLDEVECIVSESKRKKKWTNSDNAAATAGKPNASESKPLAAQLTHTQEQRSGEHVPHSLYRNLEYKSNNTATPSPYNQQVMLNLQKLGLGKGPIDLSTLASRLTPAIPPPTLPRYMKPLPARLGQDDVTYLQKKGALAIPDTSLRNELLKNYAEFVHPYMPLLDLHEFLTTIDKDEASTDDGTTPISLLLFQAVMFAGIATIEMSFLKAAGYGSRREARRDFFLKARLLYDFDIEQDRISLIQALLLMSYWYETPDDQKDSHHWMGIAVSLSHTIGLHRGSSSMDISRQKLWKRIWWCTYMRDRLIALGMRRPTKIKNGDFDVKMLTLDDFDLKVLPDSVKCVSMKCRVMREADKQRQLAIMCIEKAKLCVCISNVLSVQYSVLHNNHGVMSEEGTTRTTMMLVAKKLEPREEEVTTCSRELQAWKDNLPEEAQYVTPTWHDVDSGDESVVLNCSLLHMVYYATVSALHRPQVLPSGSAPPRNIQSEILEISRKAVRVAAAEITAIATTLFNLDLVRLLPTPGITVLLPAIIIHLLDVKSPDELIRRNSLQGFCQCMQILGKLRDIYAAADYSTAFLEAAIRKSEITLPQRSNELKEPRNVITSAQGLIDASRRMSIVVPGLLGPAGVDQGLDSGHLTPPPEESAMRASLTNGSALSDADIARNLHAYLAATPPDSDHHISDHSMDDVDIPADALDLSTGGVFLDGAIAIPGNEFGIPEPDFEGFINLDAAGETFLLEDEAFAAMHGESSGFTMDVDWMRGIQGQTNDASAPEVTAESD